MLSLLKRSNVVQDDELTIIDGKITPVRSSCETTLSEESQEIPKSSTARGELTPIELDDDISEFTYLTNVDDDEHPSGSLHIQPVETSSNGSLCYLLDASEARDVQAFVTYLTSLKRARRTQYEYIRYLRLIKRHLTEIAAQPDFSGMTVTHLQHIFQQYSPVQAHIMRSMLQTYAKYRATHQDHRLTLLIAQLPALPTIQHHRESNDVLTEAEIPLITELARELIAQRHRAGIWIMLCLYGVLPHEIKTVRITSRITIHVTRRGKDLSMTNLPTWLTRAMEHIQQWRMDRHNIYLGLQPYHLTPYVLNTYARQQTAIQQARQKALEQQVRKNMKARKKGGLKIED